MEGWRKAAKDLDRAVTQWLRDPPEGGAPAGINVHPEACGIFPPSDEAPERDFNDIVTGEDAFANYSGVDNNPIAVDELPEHI